MKKDTAINEKAWKIVMDNLPWTYRVCEEYSGISKGTLSGWKQGKHFPNGASLQCFLDALHHYLSNDEKESMLHMILKEFGIEKSSNEYYSVLEDARKDFSLVLKRILINDFLNDISFYKNKNRFVEGDIGVEVSKMVSVTDAYSL